MELNKKRVRTTPDPIRVLAIDVETTGLPTNLPYPSTCTTWNQKQEWDIRWQNGQGWTSDMLETWPRIVQLSCILYTHEPDENENENENESKKGDTIVYNRYVRIPESVVISESSFDIHHIDRTRIEQGPNEDMSTILEQLLKYIQQADMIVAHNVSFDRKMIVSEGIRYLDAVAFEQLHSKPWICTMNMMEPICNIPQVITYKDKRTGKPSSFTRTKPPKLTEAHSFLFPNPNPNPFPFQLHNSLVDVILCLRIFIQQRWHQDIVQYTTSEEIRWILQFDSNENQDQDPDPDPEREQ